MGVGHRNVAAVLLPFNRGCWMSDRRRPVTGFLITAVVWIACLVWVAVTKEPPSWN